VAEIARRRGVALIEDAAQAIGATWDGRQIGSWGDAACLSFYPTKNLGACGDAGLLLTDRDDVAERVRRLRHHGDGSRYHHVELGYCSRLDEVQAAMLRVKLSRLDGWTEARRRLAARYRAGLAGLPLALPVEDRRARHIYHQFVVRHPHRDALGKVLADLGVGTMVHYPLAVPEQPLFGLDAERAWPQAWRAAREVLSLPCYPEMTDAEVDGVIAAVQTAVHRV
jgi:dTDP-4-amino-4,6-dideoxygalactose transaminase